MSSSSLQVTNVDDEGNELGSGIMELTQTELILHTRKRDAIRWPYLCLRRYGYDSNLFSFESGRRCQTGQGKLILPLACVSYVQVIACFLSVKSIRANCRYKTNMQRKQTGPCLHEVA